MSSDSKRPDPQAQLRAQQAQAEQAKKEESKLWLIRAIYLMAFFFFFDIFYLHELLYAIIAALAQIWASIADGDTSTWVTWWKGSTMIIKVGGFLVAAGFARYLARQRG